MKDREGKPRFSHLFQLTIDDVFIANKIEKNVRKLEGCLIRLGAYASLTGNIISVSFAKEILSEFVDGELEKKTSVSDIKKTVCDYYHLKEYDMISRKRNKSVVVPRQIAMYLCRELTDCSLPEIGKNFGGRDHTTILHAYEVVKIRKEKDPNLARDIVQIIERIRGI